MLDEKLPSIGYLRGRTTTPTTGRSTAPTFAMIPENVLTDPRLTHRDIRVYGMLACARRGPFISIGERRMAERAHIARRGIRSSLQKLAEFGLLDVTAPDKRGGRARYRLTSELFGKRPAEIPEPAIPGAGRVQNREKVTCGRCGDRCFGLLKVGWCRSCNWKLKVDKQIDKKLDERLPTLAIA